MRRRYVIVPDVPEMPKADFDSPYIPGSGLIQETVAVAVIVWIGLCATALGVGLLFAPLDKMLSLAPKVLGFNLAVASIFAVALAVYRTLRHEREERLIREEIFRRWEREDALFAPDEEREEGEELSRARLDYVALTLLKRYYHVLRRTGSLSDAAHAISRERMEKEGIKQAEWNIVNRLFQEWGIRDGRRRYLKPQSFEEAWQIWLERSTNARSFKVVKGRLIPQG